MTLSQDDPFGKRKAKGKDTSARGDSNEHRVVAALLEREFNASLVDLRNSKYDIVIEISDGEFLRVQVKTGKSVGLTGGSRGGRGAVQDPTVTTYKYTTENCDCIVGVVADRNNGGDTIDFYFVPTIWAETVSQTSIGVGKLQFAKNNFELLRRCKDVEYVNDLFTEVKVKKYETTTRS